MPEEPAQAQGLHARSLHHAGFLRPQLRSVQGLAHPQLREAVGVVGEAEGVERLAGVQGVEALAGRAAVHAVALDEAHEQHLPTRTVSTWTGAEDTQDYRTFSHMW